MNSIWTVFENISADKAAMYKNTKMFRKIRSTVLWTKVKKKQKTFIKFWYWQVFLVTQMCTDLKKKNK